MNHQHWYFCVIINSVNGIDDTYTSAAIKIMIVRLVMSFENEPPDRYRALTQFYLPLFLAINFHLYEVVFFLPI